jgi:hypothetical protein
MNRIDKFFQLSQNMREHRTNHPERNPNGNSMIKRISSGITVAIVKLI